MWTKIKDSPFYLEAVTARLEISLTGYQRIVIFVFKFNDMSRISSTKYSQGGVQFSLFILRVGLGILMLTHGWPKLMHFSDMAPQFFDPFHAGGHVALSLTIFAEVFCAFMLIIGLFTRAAVIPLIIEMVIVVLMVHKGDLAHQELGIHFLIGFIVILILGPGRASVDRLISG